MFFGVLPNKIQIRKLRSIVGNFRIRISQRKAHVFCVLQPKMQIRKLPTIVGSFRIQMFHRKTHVSRCYNENPKDEIAVGSFRIRMFNFRAHIFPVLQTKFQI